VKSNKHSKPDTAIAAKSDASRLKKVYSTSSGSSESLLIIHTPLYEQAFFPCNTLVSVGGLSLDQSLANHMLCRGLRAKVQSFCINRIVKKEKKRCNEHPPLP